MGLSVAQASTKHPRGRPAVPVAPAKLKRIEAAWTTTTMTQGEIAEAVGLPQSRVEDIIRSSSYYGARQRNVTEKGKERVYELLANTARAGAVCPTYEQMSDALNMAEHWVIKSFKMLESEKRIIVTPVRLNGNPMHSSDGIGSVGKVVELPKDRLKTRIPTRQVILEKRGDPKEVYELAKTFLRRQYVVFDAKIVDRGAGGVYVDNKLMTALDMIALARAKGFGQ